MINNKKCLLMCTIISILVGLICIFATYSFLNLDKLETDIYYGTYEVGGSGENLEYLAIIPPLEEDIKEGKYCLYNSSHTNIERGNYYIDENNCLHLYNGNNAIAIVLYNDEKFLYIQNMNEIYTITKNSDEAIVP